MHETPFPSSPLPVSRRGACAWFGIGALAAWMPGLRSGSSHDVRLWVTDRGAHRLHGLDADLVPRRSIQVESPTEVESRASGGLWVLSATQGVPFGPHRLFGLEADGTVSVSLDFGTCLDLAVGGQGEAYLVEMGIGTPDRLWRIDAVGGRRVEFEASALSCVTAQGQDVLLGGLSGELWAFRAGPHGLGSPVAHGALGGEVADLAPGPALGTWWGLDRTGPGRLSLLESSLESRWERTSGLSAEHLIPVPGQERVWLADTAEPWVRRYGPGGELEVSRGDLPLAGSDRGLAWPPAAPGDGVLLAAPGALLHLDRAGFSLPGQGGFQFLVDLAPPRL